MAGDYSGNTPQPVTRLQYYMAKVAGVWDGSIPAPVTRLEYYWAAIANGEGEVFPPVTREEHFLTLVADAYSVVLTVVTGNPALLEGVKGNRFTSLTLHGKSTQGSTTGAQLFDVSNADVVQMYIANSGIGNFSENYSVVVPIKPSTSYTISEKNHKIFRVAITEEYPIESAPVLFKDVATVYKNITTPNNLPNGNFLMIQLYGNFNSVPDFSGLMLNEGSTTKPWESYTSGKPSPSPEYPQEIESAGDTGEIGVTVTGVNLLPFEVGQKGDGFEVFADGVQVDVDRRTDIYVVGQNNGNVESGYGEFALMTAGKYYIYSDSQDVYLYVTVWRKGRNFVLGYSAEAKVAQIEIMDGDKFRIFLRTKEAFNGKVKAMITRIPVNATSYEPYKPAQTLIIPTPNGLPGIPVYSGGNYTDKDDQQWVCDEVDFKKGVYVQRVAKEIPQTSFIVRETIDNEGRYQFMYAFKNIYKNGGNKCLISHGIYESCGTKKNSWAMNTTSFYYFPAERATVDKIKEKILSLINSDNPLTFLGQLETPIEIPLTTEQLAKYKALRTYSPTTTVINDAGAGMSVGYAKMK